MVRPKKRLGQHFLTDDHTAQRIAESLDINSQKVIEVGPGKGILSKFLIQRYADNFYMIEIDRESVKYLKDHFPEIGPRIIEGDFLAFNPDSIFTDHFSIIGNFPFNISSQILFRALAFRDRVDEVVGMFQKEVAERIASPPGSKKYGILSVLMQAYFSIEYLFTVHEGTFYPPPKVKSAVIRLKRNDVKQLDCDEDFFIKIVKAGFNQRRKTLRNALYAFTFELPENQSYLLQKRAEQLSVDDFVILSRFAHHN